ncbi:uncharacterized protein LOC144553815 [Carex rostrata]
MGCTGSTMISPVPVMRGRNVLIRYQEGPARQQQQEINLRRFPHLFNNVVELPIAVNSDVKVENDQDSFRFVATVDGIVGAVQVHMVEIGSHAVKIVILDEFDSVAHLDFNCRDGSRWRQRLPEYSQATMATATYQDGVLVVTVPFGNAPPGTHE